MRWKAGVSMAFLALIAGLAERAHSGPTTVNARPAAAVDYFLKLDGIKGEAKTGFLKLELKIFSLDGALGGLEHKLVSFYDKLAAQEGPGTFNSSHPSAQSRAATAKAMAQQLNKQPR